MSLGTKLFESAQYTSIFSGPAQGIETEDSTITPLLKKIRKETDTEIEEMTRKLEEREKKIEELGRELESARSGEREKKIEALEKELESARSGEKEKKIEEEEDVYVSMTEVVKMQKVINELKAQKVADDVIINQYKRQFQSYSLSEGTVDRSTVEIHKIQEAIKRLREMICGRTNDKWMTTIDQLNCLEQVRTKFIGMTKDLQHWRTVSSANFVYGEKPLEESPNSEVSQIELKLAQDRIAFLEEILPEASKKWYAEASAKFQQKLVNRIEDMRRAAQKYYANCYKKTERKRMVVAREKVEGLEKTLEAYQLEYQKNLEEAQEKIVKLEKTIQMYQTRICDCVTNEKETVERNDIEEEMQKMRDAVRHNEEGMTKLRDVIIGEKSMEIVDECTVDSGHGLLHKIKTLEELCCSKDSVIDAMKEQSIITEYELFQLREIVQLTSQYPQPGIDGENRLIETTINFNDGSVSL